MKHAALAAIALCSMSTFAQNVMETPVVDNLTGWTFAGRVYFDQLDTAQATTEGVKDSLSTLQLAADYNTPTWKSTLWLDILMYSDERPFSQWVEGTGWSNSGDVSQKKSSASGIMIGAATGPQWVFGADQNVVAYVQGGLDVMVRSTREIAACSNCYSEDINLDGGAVVISGLERHGENWIFGANLRHHLSGDFKTGFGLTLGYKF